MNAFEIALTIFLPALGASGAWIAWHRAQDYIAESRERRRARAGDRRLTAGMSELLPENPRLSAEIERLR
jgi:hypothetical protein